MKFRHIFALLLASVLLIPSARAQEVAENAAAPETLKQAESAAEGAQDDAQKMIDAVQAYYDSAATYSAEFVQDYETVDGIKSKSSGTVWFKKPGLMRWDYDKPESRFLLSDGEHFWSWEPVYRQYCKQKLENAQLPTALTFLAGKGRIDDDFNVKIGNATTNRISLILTPKVPSTAYENITFEVLMPTAKVYRVVLNDSMGNENTITFKSPELNAKLNEKLFKFTPPKDANHICE